MRVDLVDVDQDDLIDGQVSGAPSNGAPEAEPSHLPGGANCVMIVDADLDCGSSQAVPATQLEVEPLPPPQLHGMSQAIQVDNVMPLQL